ncbi:SPRY domain-containing protein [Wukongibacter baidiensis]|uniref:SPRY domain-containing protein n=1 Tax=Wukongibacter baidiensis TaxID=1723361 RepID=UPI003D7FC332
MSIKRLGILLLMVCFIFSSLGTQAFAVGVEVTLNQNDKESSLELSNGNLSVNNPGGSYRGIRATKEVTSGKWYYEVKIEEGGRIDAAMVGVTTKDEVLNHGTSIDSLQYGRVYRGNGTTWINNKSYGEVYNVGDTIGVALDMDNGTIEFYKNGESQGIAYTDLLSLNEVYPFLIIYDTGKMTANFGNTPFQYDIPEGFSPYNGESSEQNGTSVLDIEPEKEKIKVNEKVTADLVIDNISEIAAEDIKIDYDEEKLEFLGFEEVDGMKLVKSIEETDDGELRVIIASEGEDNIVDNKEILLKLEFKGIEVGEALVDIAKGRVTDGIEMEKDLTDEECGEGTIIIEAMADVNNSGEFTLLDLGIDARHFSKDPESSELEDYNTDVVVNGEIDEDDLLEIAKYMLENPNYEPNN